MYSLTCPSCEHRARSPFIRLGAVVKCASCGTKVQIRAENVRRQVKIKPQYDKDDLFTVAVVERAIEEELSTPAPTEAAPPPAPESVAADADQGHAHDHSHDHAHANDHSPHLQEIAAATKPPPSRTRSKVKAKVKAKAKAAAAQQRNNMSAVYIGGGAVLAVVLIIVAIMMLTGGSNDPAKDSTTDGGTKDTLVTKDGPTKDAVNVNKDSTATKDSRPVQTKDDTGKDANVKKDGNSKNPTKDRTKDNSKDGGTKDGKTVVPPVTVTIKAEPIGKLTWQNQSTSFQPAIPVSAVTLNNVTRKTSGNGATFSADVTVQQMVLSAIVQLALINEEDRVYARFDVPVTMLDSKQPRKLQIDIPAEYLTALEHLHWEVSDVSSPSKQMVMLADGLGEFVKQASDAEVRISARNPDGRELTKTGFALAAMDIDGRLLGQWKLDYDKAIGANERVEFVASVPMPNADKVNRWAVYAAGLPSNAPPVVTNTNQPPKPDPDDRNPRPFRPSGRGIFDF